MIVLWRVRLHLLFAHVFSNFSLNSEKRQLLITVFGKYAQIGYLLTSTYI
jgi:hypothetical protein